jgi:Sugar (and other) transporter
MGIDVTLWPYCAELFPNHLRSKGVAICTTVVSLTSLIYLEVASTAFARIGWKFYMVCLIIRLMMTNLLILKGFHQYLFRWTGVGLLYASGNNRAASRGDCRSLRRPGRRHGLQRGYPEGW